MLNAQEMMMNETRYIVFLLFFVIFFFEDIRNHSVNNAILIAYLLIGMFFVTLNIYYHYIEIEILSYAYIVEVILSILLGTIIYIISIISKEAIGKGDAIYFLINGFYLSFIENISLFIMGIMVSTIISIFIYIKNRGRVKNIIIPFIPCLLPMILWRLVCIQ